MLMFLFLHHIWYFYSSFIQKFKKQEYRKARATWVQRKKQKTVWEMFHVADSQAGKLLDYASKLFEGRNFLNVIKINPEQHLNWRWCNVLTTPGHCSNNNLILFPGILLLTLNKLLYTRLSYSEEKAWSSNICGGPFGKNSGWQLLPILEKNSRQR